MFLLDTNIISELRKTKPHGAVIAWSQAYGFRSYFIPTIVLFELQAGAEITRRQNPVKAEELDRWIASVVATQQVVPLDSAAARDAARLLYGKSPDLTIDAMIASVARTRGLIVATRNVRDFRGFDVPVVDPFLHTE